MTEADRKQKKIAPPDPQAWNEQMYKVRLLHQLTDNTDFRNIRNVLSDPSFRVYAVDCSRGFTIYTDLRAEKELVRFSRSVLEALKALDRPTLEAKLGPWLGGPQIDGLLKRRDKIVALAAKPRRGARERRPSSTDGPGRPDRRRSCVAAAELGRDLPQVVLAERDGRHRRVRPSRARVAQPVGKGLVGPGALARSRLRVERREEAGEVGPRVPGADGPGGPEEAVAAAALLLEDGGARARPAGEVDAVGVLGRVRAPAAQQEGDDRLRLLLVQAELRG